MKVDDASLTSLPQNSMEMQQSIALWSGIFYYTVLTDNNLKIFCDDWDNCEKNIADDLQSRLRSCPRMLLQARAPNSGFTEQKMTSVVGDTSYASQWMNYFHPLADVCFVQSTFIRYRSCSSFVTLQYSSIFCDLVLIKVHDNNVVIRMDISMLKQEEEQQIDMHH